MAFVLSILLLFSSSILRLSRLPTPFPSLVSSRFVNSLSTSIFSFQTEIGRKMLAVLNFNTLLWVLIA